MLYVLMIKASRTKRLRYEIMYDNKMRLSEKSDENPIVVEKCPVTCSICCEDDPYFFYNGSPACALLASFSDEQIQEYCTIFEEARFNCPITCNTCPAAFSE